MIVKLLTEHHLEFLSLKGGCTGMSESSPVKMSNCWKSHATAQIWFWYISYGFALIIFLTYSLKNVFYFSIISGYPFSTWLFVHNETVVYIF